MAIALTRDPARFTFAAATTAGGSMGGAGTNPSLYIAMVTAENYSSGTISVSDDIGGSYGTADVTVAGSGDGSNLGCGNIGIFSRQNTSTSTATVTATLNVATYGVVKLYELTGAATSSAKDASGTGSGNGTQISVAVTTTIANSAMFVAMTFYNNGGTLDAGYTGSFTSISGNNSLHYGSYNLNVGATGTKTLTRTNYTPQGWVGAAVAYKIAGGAPAPPLPYSPYQQLGPLLAQ